MSRRLLRLGEESHSPLCVSCFTLLCVHNSLGIAGAVDLARTTSTDGRKGFRAGQVFCLRPPHCFFRFAVQFTSRVRPVLSSLRVLITNFLPSGVTS
jgi:hypothetical protein